MEQRDTRSWLWRGLAGVAASALAGWAVVAGAGAGRAAKPVPAVNAASVQAMRVEVQPESGNLVPQTGGATVMEAPGNLVIERRPDGSSYVNLQGHYMSYTVMQRTPDGHLEQTCTTDPNAALATNPAGLEVR